MFSELSFSSDSLGTNSSFYLDSLCIHWSEHPLIKCLKAKTNVITTANLKKGNTFKSQWELKEKPTKLLQAQENMRDKSWLVLVWHMIGWESGTSFWEQSQSAVKLKQSNPGFLSILHWKLLKMLSTIMEWWCQKEYISYYSFRH